MYIYVIYFICIYITYTYAKGVCDKTIPLWVRLAGDNKPSHIYIHIYMYMYIYM